MKAVAFMATPYNPLPVLILRMPSMPWVHPEPMATINTLIPFVKIKA